MIGISRSLKVMLFFVVGFGLAACASKPTPVESIGVVGIELYKKTEHELPNGEVVEVVWF